jgi:23S rRNA A2030 N6-methylase RlmJ
MKLRTQTNKRMNIDTTSSTIVTPVKQRRLVNEIADTMKNVNITQNISSHSVLTANTSTGFKTSMMVGFVPLFKFEISLPLILDNTRKTSID